MGDPNYRATGGALTFDAYYKDEWGVVNASDNCELDASERAGFHKNVFTSVVPGTPPREMRETFSAPFKNRANPATNAALKDKSNPVPRGYTDDFRLQFYCADAVRAYWQGLKKAGAAWDSAKPIDLTLYFGVGSELVRHGIRSFFKRQTGMQAIMQIPGMEKPQFGVAIDDAQIKAALQGFFGMDPVPYRIRVLAGFSTGSCGLNQTLLNDLVDFSAVERLVFYDCLYASQCGSTAAAIKNLKSKASDRLKIVVYKASECANSFKENPNGCPDTAKTKCPAFRNGKCLDFNRLAVVVDNRGLIDGNGVVANLFQNTSYIALVMFRALEGAVEDGVIALPKANERPFRDMQSLLAATPRGTMISNRACYRFVRGSVPASGATLFEDWAASNKKVINAFYRKVGSVGDKGSFRQLLWGNALPGWPGGDGEDKHDLLIPEFGWEYLPY